MSPRRGMAAYVQDQRLTQTPDQAVSAGVTELAPPAAVAVRTVTDRARKQSPSGPRRPRKTRKAVALPQGQEEAWAAVMAARDSARRRPGDWVVYGLRLPAEIWEEVTRLVAVQKAQTQDRLLNPCHVINAAIDSVPASLAEAGKLGLEWQAGHGFGRTRTTGSGRRLHQDNAAKLGSISDRLPLLDDRISTWEVAAMAVANLLARLSGLPETGGTDGGDGGHGPSPG